MTKARDLANFNPTNITDTGTEGTKVASGTTAQRGSTTGQFRFNSTTGLAEYYTGNGSTDGTFVYTGFKPAFVMIKCSSSGGSYTSWSIFDTTRQTFNVNSGKTLYANRSYEEGKRGQGDASTTIPGIDMLSNGFKCRVLNDEVNNTAEYIYMAIGQSIVGSNNVPATAR